MSIRIGDFVKGITSDYAVTDTKMTRGLVTDVCDGSIVVRVLDHDDGADGTYTVDPKDFDDSFHNAYNSSMESRISLFCYNMQLQPLL